MLAIAAMVAYISWRAFVAPLNSEPQPDTNVQTAFSADAEILAQLIIKDYRDEVDAWQQSEWPGRSIIGTGHRCLYLVLLSTSLVPLSFALMAGEAIWRGGALGEASVEPARFLCVLFLGLLAAAAWALQRMNSTMPDGLARIRRAAQIKPSRWASQVVEQASQKPTLIGFDVVVARTALRHLHSLERELIKEAIEQARDAS